MNLKLEPYLHSCPTMEIMELCINGCKQNNEQLNYLVKTRTSKFKITTKPIIKLWNIECFHFND